MTVMTQNAYHGVDAELAQAAAATTFPQFLAAAAAVFQGYHARNFPERAAAIADQIHATRPDLVALQEMVLARTDEVPPTLDGPATPATDVSLDFLQILLEALSARGLRYVPAVVFNGWDIEVPTALGVDLRHTDRQVILVRADGDLRVSRAQAGHYVANCVLPTALGPTTVRRGWVSIDASVRGRGLRLIGTHLDGDCPDPAIQVAQARELLLGPADTALPVVLAGDLNSRADGSGTPTYANLLASGFTDAWAVAGSGPGLTCCQDDSLLNSTSVLSDRRDFVLVRGDVEIRRAALVGVSPADRTPSGLWPSDHAGVVSTLELPRHGHHDD